jgi:hypothetical protein
MYRSAVELVSGKGSRVTDASRRSYLDFFGGIRTSMLGYDVAEVREALERQLAAGVTHTSALYLIRNQVERAEKIARRLTARDSPRGAAGTSHDHGTQENGTGNEAHIALDRRQAVVRGGRPAWRCLQPGDRAGDRHRGLRRPRRGGGRGCGRSGGAARLAGDLAGQAGQRDVRLSRAAAVGAENLCHLGRCPRIAVGSVKRLGVGRAGLGSAGGGMIFG